MRDLYIVGLFLSFSELSSEFNLPPSRLFFYFQIRHCFQIFQLSLLTHHGLTFWFLGLIRSHPSLTYMEYLWQLSLTHLLKL